MPSSHRIWTKVRSYFKEIVSGFKKLISLEDKENPGIYICYRTGDTIGYAAWLYEKFVEKFGHKSVFLDIVHIEYGANFVKEIEAVLNNCKVLTALIGDRWLSLMNTKRTSSLNGSEDYVCLEISTTLQRKLNIFPVLFGKALMPRKNDLPLELEEFSYLNPVRIKGT